MAALTMTVTAVTTMRIRGLSRSDAGLLLGLLQSSLIMKKNGEKMLGNGTNFFSSCKVILLIIFSMNSLLKFQIPY